MRKFIIVMVAALAFVACEKNGADYDILVRLTPQSVDIDKDRGGVVVIETDIDSYIGSIVKINSLDNSASYNVESESFFRTSPPEYLVKFEDIIKYDKYEAFGCKVIPDGFRRYTIMIEPNCDCNLFEIYFHRIIESESYGKIGGHAPSTLKIHLK